MKQLYVNNFASALVGEIAAGDGILTLANAADLPVPAANEFFLLTLIGLDANGNEVLWEVVKVTSRSGTTLTAARGQESTAARAWPDGTLVEARLTAGSMNGKEDAIADGTAEQFWRGDKSWQSILAAVQGALLTGLNLAVGTAISEADSVLSAMGKLQKQITNATTNLAANVRLTALSGYLLASNTALANTDTVEGAFGKVQAQLDAKLPVAGGALSGNLSFSGNGRRITGEFSAAAGSFANRTFFQSSTPNNQTQVSAIPSGTSGIAGFQAFSSIDMENCSRAAIGVVGGTGVYIGSEKLGAGAYLPLMLSVGGYDRVVIETGGMVNVVNDLGGAYGQFCLRSVDATKRRFVRIASSNSLEMVNQAANAVTHQFFNDGWTAQSGGGYCVFDNSFAWGLGSNRWSVFYSGTGAINTSDQREKTPLRELSEAELAVAVDLVGEIGIYQWLEAVEKKGDEARLHLGPTTQRVQAVFERHGLDAMRYGVFCYDQWDELPEKWSEPVLDEQTGEEVQPAMLVQAHRPAGDRYSLRYDQLSMFMARGAAEKQRRIEARLAALEAAA